MSLRFPSMNTTNSHLTRQLRRVEQTAILAIERIRRAKTIADLLRAMAINVRAEVRPLKHLCPSLSRLKHEADKRGRAIVDQQLIRLSMAASTQEFIARRGPLVAEWRTLYGHLPSVARYAESQSSRLWSECFKREYVDQSNEPHAAADNKEA